MELHPATLWEAISDAVPDRPAIIQGEVRRTWRSFEERSAALAGVLLAHGIRPGSKVGLLLANGPEYLEGYFAALKVRAVPFNINYRYTADELAYLLDNADAEALVYHASFSEAVRRAIASAGASIVLIEVDDGGVPLAESLRYEAVLAAGSPAERIERSPDDITMTYTGGTTGMPKAVMGKVGPTLAGLLATVPSMVGRPPVEVDDVAALTVELDGTPDLMVSLPASPLMHATALGIGVLPAFAVGGTVVLLAGRHRDAAELWDTVAAHRVNAITIVGDPFARPMLAELEANPSRDLTSLRFLSSSGAMFSTEVKAGLFAHLPQVVILDFIAASEGAMGLSASTAGSPAPTGRFRPSPGVIVISDDDRPLPPGSPEPGRIALPGGAEGYYKDEVKSAATFKVIDGVRYTVPGDYATIDAEGLLTLLGRGSSCINTAGEKVYPEEVEEALKALPWVADALVFGVDDERFGQRVAAVVSRAPGTNGATQEIIEATRERLAAYKVPRSIVFVDVVPRTQVGKADYPSARRLFVAG